MFAKVICKICHCWLFIDDAWHTKIPMLLFAPSHVNNNIPRYIAQVESNNPLALFCVTGYSYYNVTGKGKQKHEIYLIKKRIFT